MAAPAMITTLDEFEAEYRSDIGFQMAARGSREASIDNILRFGGIGDYNPLYRSKEYAGKSRFGMVTAPPIFIYGASLGIAMAINGNIDGRRLSSSFFPMNYAGGTIDFRKTIWPGDRIAATEAIVDIHRKHSDRLGDFVLCEALVSYHNQRKELDSWPPRRRSSTVPMATAWSISRSTTRTRQDSRRRSPRSPWHCHDAPKSLCHPPNASRFLERCRC